MIIDHVMTAALTDRAAEHHKPARSNIQSSRGEPQTRFLISDREPSIEGVRDTSTTPVVSRAQREQIHGAILGQSLCDKRYVQDLSPAICAGDSRW